MGYSPPKKQLDLKEFLSTPAKKRPGAKGFGPGRYGSRQPPTPEATRDAQQDEASTDAQTPAKTENGKTDQNGS